MYGFGDAVGNSAGLNIRAPRYNNEGICQNGSRADLEGQKFFGFFIERGFADDVDKTAQAVILSECIAV